MEETLGKTTLVSQTSTLMINKLRTTGGRKEKGER
jgi:hypothetical protein